jgi:AraC-like DNA-binding protein
MERLTIDNKRGFTLAAYFEPNEDFKEQNASMLKLVYVPQGTGIIKLNEQTVIFSAPALFCFNELDEVALQQNINLAARSIYFDPAIIDDSLQLNIIRRNYTQLSLTQYRDFFLIIPFIDREKFRSSTGTSIIEYLVKLRIKIASTMLRDTMLPVSEILDRVGFNDSVHFIRMFKKHIGCTPSEYREKFIC